MVVVLRVHIATFLFVWFAASSSQITDVFEATPVSLRAIGIGAFSFIFCQTGLQLLQAAGERPPRLIVLLFLVACACIPGYGTGLLSLSFFGILLILVKRTKSRCLGYFMGFGILGAYMLWSKWNLPGRGVMEGICALYFLVSRVMIFLLVASILICLAMGIFWLLIKMLNFAHLFHAVESDREQEIVQTNQEAAGARLKTLRVIGRLVVNPSFWALIVLLISPFPPVSIYLTPPLILLSSAACWLILLTQVQLWSIKSKIPLLSLALLWAIALSVFGLNYIHDVRVLRSDSMTQPILEDAFRAWIHSRTDKDTFSAEPYPVILVAAEGGGIRSAYSTAMILSSLSDQMPAFRDHLFAISGVSGGSVGAAIFSGLCQDTHERRNFDSSNLADLTDKILSKDFLSGSLAALFGPEIFQRFLPFPRQIGLDRAVVLEQAFEASYFQETGSELFSGDFRALYNPTQSVPLLFLNATDSSTGKAVVLSTVKVDDPEATYLLQGNPELALRLSTAALLGARFPLISPPGIVNLKGGSRLALVDGGYIDNTGTRTLCAIVRALAAIKPDEHWPKKGIRIVVIAARFKASNQVGHSSGVGLSPIDSYEIVPVLRALLSSREALATSYDMLDLTMRQVGGKISCSLAEFNLDDHKHLLPLGWYISPDARDAIRGQIPRKESGKVLHHGIHEYLDAANGLDAASGFGTPPIPPKNERVYYWPPKRVELREAVCNELAYDREVLLRSTVRYQKSQAARQEAEQMVWEGINYRSDTGPNLSKDFTCMKMEFGPAELIVRNDPSIPAPSYKILRCLVDLKTLRENIAIVKPHCGVDYFDCDALREKLLTSNTSSPDKTFLYVLIALAKLWSIIGTARWAFIPRFFHA